VPSNLWLLLEPSIKQHAASTAWICRQRKSKRIISYQQIYDSALCTANDLRQSGVNADDTVGINAPNGPEWTIAALAAFRIGAKVAPIHTGNSEHEIESQISAVNPRVMLVHDSAITHSNLIPIALQSDSKKIDTELKIPAADDPDAVAVRIYTSGSTGKPKVVKLSHGNIASNTIAATKIESFDSSDKFISLLPFSHAMGLTGNATNAPVSLLGNVKIPHQPS
jgi:long-subunit acyl-CoA synthetase (AMP-forming)